MPLEQDDFRVRRCGESNGPVEAMGHSVCTLEALLRHSGERFIVLHESSISY